MARKEVIEDVFVIYSPYQEQSNREAVDEMARDILPASVQKAACLRFAVFTSPRWPTMAALGRLSHCT